MIRNFKKKHGFLYLGILFLFGFIFVSKCLESSSTVNQSPNTEPELSIAAIKSRLQSDSVITRRNAFAVIEKRKLKQFIPDLQKILLSPEYTPEDRRLSARAIGAICSIYDAKALIGLLNSESYKNFRLPILDAISTYLDHSSQEDFKLRLKSELSTFITLLKNETPEVKKNVLEIVRKIRYQEAYDAVYALLSNIDTKAYALVTLAAITTPQQQPVVLDSLKKLLESETNIIIRRIIRRSIYYLEQPQFLNKIAILNLISDIGSNILDTRQKAYEKLLEYKQNDLQPFLQKTLFDIELRVRLMSARLAGDKNISLLIEDLDKCAAESLRFHKGHNDYSLHLDIANAAILSIGKIRAAKSFDILKKYLHDPRLKETIYRAISYFTTEDSIKLLEASFLTETEEVKSIIAGILFQKKQYDFFIRNIKIGNDYMRLIILKFSSLIETPEVQSSLKQAYELEANESKWKKILKMALEKKL